MRAYACVAQALHYDWNASLSPNQFHEPYGIDRCDLSLRTQTFFPWRDRSDDQKYVAFAG